MNEDNLLDPNDECPKCDSQYGVYLGSYNVECSNCEHVYNLRELKGLPTSTCAACFRRLSYGCGHTTEQELSFIEHQNSTDHLLGDCSCYVSSVGYIAFVSREERREQVAEIVRKSLKTT